MRIKLIFTLALMTMVSSCNEGKTESEFTGRKQEVFNIFKRFNSANKHKMMPIPVCEIPENLK